MWLFIKNQGFNARNYYKLELMDSKDGSQFAIYELCDNNSGEIQIKTTTGIHPEEKTDFKETLYQLLGEKFIVFEDDKKTVWINKDMLKMIEIRALENNSIAMTVETVSGVREKYLAANSYPEFNLFWIRNFKNNVYDDITVTVPSPDMFKKGRKSKLEKVINV